MNQIQSVEWIPFNAESKPKKDGLYLVTKYGHTTTQYYSVDPLRIENSWTGITAYAELPKGYDPTARKFNFQTALARMKAGKTIISVETGVMYNLDDDGIMEGHYADGTTYKDETFTLSEIEGLWEEA